MNEFQFDCPKFGQNIFVPGNWSGRHMTCPSCETSMIIPEPEGPKGDRARPVGIEAAPIKVPLKARPKGGAKTNTAKTARPRGSRPLDG